MNSYKAKIEVTVVSNKNTNKYKMTQEYKKGEYCMQEVEEPENIRGVRIEYSNNTLSLKILIWILQIYTKIINIWQKIIYF